MSKLNEKKTDVTELYEMYDPANPYALGRKEYNDRYERLVKNAASWRRIAFLMLLMLTVSVSVVLWMAQSVKVVPFIVQVDRHGYEIAVQAVVPSHGTDDRITMSRIANFVESTRSVYSDRAALVSLLVKSYDSIAAGSPAQEKLDTHFRDNNPLVLDNITVNVIVQSVLRAAPESDKMWQVEWYEETYDRGVFVRKIFYKGMFETEVKSPTSLQEIMKNPLGIFIRDFNFTEKLVQ